jgi:hypothetical protein
LRVAYLILAHRNPDQLRRLVDRLEPDAPVFVHFDARAPRRMFARAERLLSSCSNVRFVPRHRCYWGSFNIVRATLECIHALVESGVEYDYATLLSGQHYPLRDAEGIRAFLSERRGAEFIEAFPLDLPNRWTDHSGRFQSRARVHGFHLRVRSRWLTLPVRRRFPEGVVPHGGSQWWSLTRDCLDFVHRFSIERADVLRYFRRVFIPDESYFQTVVAASPFADRAAGDDLTFAIWDRPVPPYPATLATRDLDSLSSSEKLFARKFDMTVDAAVLDLIDSRVKRAAGA